MSHPENSNAAQTFSYAVAKSFAPICALFGFRSRRDHVAVTNSGEFTATFGFIRLSTPLSNISGAHITRNYRWWTAAGVRASWVDDGLSFGTNRDAGVCVHFIEKVPSKLKKTGHSALTVTVADFDGLTRTLGEAEPNS